MEECLYCESFCQEASKLYNLIWDIQKARRHIIPKTQIDNCSDLAMDYSSESLCRDFNLESATINGGRSFLFDLSAIIPSKKPAANSGFAYQSCSG